MNYRKKLGAYRVIMFVIAIVIFLLVFLWNFLTQRV
jgi:hypothetical protein